MTPIQAIIKRGRNLEYPAKICIKRSSQKVDLKLYDTENHKKLIDIKSDLNKVKQIFLQAITTKNPIITNDGQTLAEIIGLENIEIDSNIYADDHIIEKEEDYSRSIVSDTDIAILPYHKLSFQAGIVYKKMSDHPIYINYTPVRPIWSMDTFSGRSKCCGFNIQGYNQSDYVSRDGNFENKLLIHFDWMCADLRIASILSKDEELEYAFKAGDPYQYLLDKSNGLYVDRKESKIALLKAINSINFDSNIFNICYKNLREWLLDSAHKLTNDIPLETILGKKFIIPDDKTILSSINGVLQGSIAHAMQNVLCKVHRIFPRSVICEIHDSLVLSCENDHGSIKHMVSTVMNIMSKPFAGILDRDIYFPLRYGIGKKWRDYKFSEIQREKHEPQVPKDPIERAEESTSETQA